MQTVSEMAVFYRETICLLNRTGPIRAYSGDAPFSGITVALPNYFVQGSACLISAAEPAQLPQVLRKLLGHTDTWSVSIATKCFSTSPGENTR
jgi:hypothetical protein